MVMMLITIITPVVWPVLLILILRREELVRLLPVVNIHENIVRANTNHDENGDQVQKREKRKP